MLLKITPKGSEKWRENLKSQKKVGEFTTLITR